MDTYGGNFCAAMDRQINVFVRGTRTIFIVKDYDVHPPYFHLQLGGRVDILFHTITC